MIKFEETKILINMASRLEMFMREFVELASEMKKLIDHYELEDEVAMVAGVSHLTEDEDDRYDIAFAMSSPCYEDVEQLVTFLLDAAEMEEEHREPPEGTIEWWEKKFGNGSIN
jgi:hypothetical protein